MTFLLLPTLPAISLPIRTLKGSTRPRPQLLSFRLQDSITVVLVLRHAVIFRALSLCPQVS
jgi:hypothetical protein